MARCGGVPPVWASSPSTPALDQRVEFRLRRFILDRASELGADLLHHLDLRTALADFFRNTPDVMVRVVPNTAIVIGVVFLRVLR